MKPWGRVFKIKIGREARHEAQHCSSLCLQSEGDEYSGGQARVENSTRSCPGFSPHVRGPHFASKVSYNAVAPDFRHASVPLINPCFNSIKHPIRFHGNSKTLHPSSEGLYYLSTRGRQ